VAADFEVLRRERDGYLATAESSRSDEGARLIWLERALVAQREVARLDAMRIAALAPCRMCGRKVTSPCHDAEGYYEGGPWDGGCGAFAKGPDRA
jgi:hypothetical protein